MIVSFGASPSLLAYSGVPIPENLGEVREQPVYNISCRLVVLSLFPVQRRSGTVNSSKSVRGIRPSWETFMIDDQQQEILRII
jgi:hypothetical protein